MAGTRSSQAADRRGLAATGLTRPVAAAILQQAVPATHAKPSRGRGPTWSGPLLPRLAGRPRSRYARSRDLMARVFEPGGVKRRKPLLPSPRLMAGVGPAVGAALRTSEARTRPTGSRQGDAVIGSNGRGVGAPGALAATRAPGTASAGSAAEPRGLRPRQSAGRPAARTTSGYRRRRIASCARLSTAASNTQATAKTMTPTRTTVRTTRPRPLTRHASDTGRSMCRPGHWLPRQ